MVVYSKYRDSYLKKTIYLASIHTHGVTTNQLNIDTSHHAIPHYKFLVCFILFFFLEFEYTLKYGNDNNEGLILTRCDSSQEWQGFCGNDWLDSAYAHTVASRHFGLNETARGFVLPLSILRSPLSIIGGLMCYGDEKDLSQCTITHSVYCSGYAALKGVSSK